MKTIIANWKNHPETLEKAKELFEFEVTEAIKYPNLKTVICPPEQFLRPLAEINKKSYLKILYWFFVILGILIIGAGIYLILRNLGVI